MTQNEHVNVARAVVAAVQGLCRKGLTLDEAAKLVGVWIDSAENRGANKTAHLKASADYFESRLIQALTPSRNCPHSWEKGACANCGVLRMHADPEGYAAEAEQNERHRQALSATWHSAGTALPKPPRIPIKRSS